MANESENILLFIASADDTIQFCGINEDLAIKFKNMFGKDRKVTFDPYISLASNKDLISENDFFSKKGKSFKRQFGTFDVAKYCKFFIEKKNAFLEDSDNPDIHRTGFDAYSYYMANEDDINTMYAKSEGLSKLQKAALHFIEIGSEEPELDYIKYVASHDDILVGAVESKPDDKTWEEWVPAVGKLHYESTGKLEIHEGTRPVTEFFNATKYIATYPAAADAFKDESGILDDRKAALGYITVGAFNGFIRNGFNPYVYLANYPQLIKEDIYVNDQINIGKVARLWLDNFKNGIKLDKFDPKDFIESMNLESSADAYKTYVESKVADYKHFLKKQKSLFNKFYRFFTCRSKSEFSVI
jgi:hypothetical protein